MAQKILNKLTTTQMGVNPSSPKIRDATTLNIALQNQTTSSTVYAYITGQAIDSNNALFLLQADAKTPYYPTSPSATGQPLAQNCAIPLGAPGNTVTATIPHIAGGRIWFSIDSELTFLLNPGDSGPGLVEPAVANADDPNDKIQWDFCEFTWNSSQLFANISYVDFVSIPVALSLTNTSGATQSVTGMAAGGLDTVCTGLQAQQAADNAGWASLVIPKAAGGNLRALSPNTGIARNASLFSGYYQPYVDAVWAKYGASAGQQLGIVTQAEWGTVNGSVNASNALDFGSGLTFGQPSAADIFGCSSGPFAPSSSIEMGALIARLSAAFDRSTLLVDTSTPGATPAEYYQDKITNHYARIVHAANADGKGYAFPFDDVKPDGAEDQSGAVQDGSPQLWTVTVGGGQVTAPAKAQLEL